MLPRTGPIGVAVTAWSLWQRLPPSQRRIILEQLGRHGPKVAAAAATYVRSRKRI
jgi:hypothetical protein